LYIDDGDSIVQSSTSNITFTYSKNGHFSMTGSFGYDGGVSIESVVVLGQKKKPSTAGGKMLFDASSGSVTHEVDISLKEAVSMRLV
jgi:alpha-glucosidase